MKGWQEGVIGGEKGGERYKKEKIERSKKHKTKTTAQNGDQCRASVRCEILQAVQRKNRSPEGALIRPGDGFVCF